MASDVNVKFLQQPVIEVESPVENRISAAEMQLTMVVSLY